METLVPFRRILLKGMLWSLGLTAAGGVLAVLVEQVDVVSRVIGMGLATAAACGALIPITMIVDRRDSRPAGLLGMTVIVLEYLTGLLLIWEVPRHLFGRGLEDEFALTMVFVGLSAIIAMGLLRLRAVEVGRLAATVGLAATGAALASLLVSVWGPPGPQDDWMESGAALFVGGALATAALIGVTRNRRGTWQWLGVVAAVPVVCLWLSTVWLDLHSDAGVISHAVFIALASVVAHANLLLLCPLPAAQHWLRRYTIAAGMLTAALAVGIVTEVTLLDRFTFDLLHRLTAAVAIVTGCGTLAVLVLARVYRGVDFEPDLAELREIRLRCPRCRKMQTLELGDALCGSCGLRISVRVEEPRCATCGYLLHGLTSDRCPECGTPIARPA
jgi:hypothetical protein